jgi:hypothetical protein
MLSIPHLSNGGMYGGGSVLFLGNPKKGNSIILLFWGLIKGVMSTFFKKGGMVLFQFCHVAKVGIIPKMI